MFVSGGFMAVEVIRREYIGGEKSLADIWAEEWEKAKEKMKRKIAKRAQTWKEAAKSPKAATKYLTNVIIAAIEGRREKGLDRVSPEDWVAATVKGIDEKTLGEPEKRKFMSRAAPYISLVQWAREEFRKIAWPDGITAGHWWMENVSKLLQIAKGDPSKIPTVRNELAKRFSEARAKYGEKTLTFSERLALVRQLLSKIAGGTIK